MALFHALVVVFVCAKLSVQEVMLFRNSENYKIGKMLRLRDVRLNVKAFVVGEFADDMKCVASCVKTDDCYSVNVKQQASGVGCELLNRTLYHYPKNLTRDTSSHHWFAQVYSLLLQILAQFFSRNNAL